MEQKRNKSGRLVMIATWAAIAVAAFASPSPSQAASYKQIYSFGSNPSAADTALPIGNLAAHSGVLYGASIYGTTILACEVGGAFSLTPSTTGGAPSESVIQCYGGYGGIAQPFGGLVAATDGTLYGTGTNSGGYSVSGVPSYGGVFSLTPPSAAGGDWTDTPLHYFTDPLSDPPGPVDALNPLASLTIANGGTLYGTSAGGGTGGFGAVYTLNPTTLAEKVLYSFANSPDGAYPAASLLPIKGGLVGTTEFGGSASAYSGNGCGTVFKLSAPVTPGSPWVETVLYTFAGAPDGCLPTAALVAGKNGVLYGTTSAGGSSVMLGGSGEDTEAGTVFSLTPPSSSGGSWTENVLYAFHVTNDGATPTGSLVLGPGGVLYGTTSGGGSAANAGTVFSLTPPTTAGGAWTENIIHDFSGAPDGQGPNAGLTLLNGVLYGTTEWGGLPCYYSSLGCGTVFAVKP